MKELICNELRFYFSKRNLGLFIVACLLIIGLFYSYFVPVHNNYLMNQMNYYNQMIDADSTRVELINNEIKKQRDIEVDITELEKSRDFWHTDMEDCRQISNNLVNGNAVSIAESMMKRDKHLQKVIDEGGDLSSYSIMLRNNETDLNNRIKINSIYLDNRFYDFIYEKKPTGYYMLSNLFDVSGMLIIVILSFVLLSNFDCWSKEFESSSYKLLFIINSNRKKVYIARTVVITLFTMFLCFILIGIIFGLGYFTYGLGNETIILTNETFVDIGEWCINRLIVLTILLCFVSIMIQTFSFITKNSGISLLVPCLFVLIILTDTYLFKAIFSVHWIVLLIFTILILLIPICISKYIANVDLYGND